MSVNTGWICPRCSDVNSPSVQRCGCNDYKNRLQAPFKVGSPYKADDSNMFRVHPDSVVYVAKSAL